MSNPKCTVCGHTNVVGAEVCEMCDSRLGDAAGAGASAGQSFHSSYPGQAEEPRTGALPTDIPLPHFKGAGDVFAPTLDVYKKNFPLVGLIVLLSALPLCVVQLVPYLLTVLPGGGEPVAALGTAGRAGILGFVVGTALLSALLTLAADAFLSGALVYGVVELQRAGEAKASDCIRWAIRKLPKLFVVTLIYMVITIVGYMLLIVPGVIFSLMFSMAVPVAAAENRGIIESFQRSKELTDGYKGLIFLTFFLWGLGVAVVGLIVSGSFALGGMKDSVAPLILQVLIQQMLKSTTTVLTVFIFLGLLHEHRHGFDTRAFTPEHADAAR
jgi:hypothetical protein